MQDAARGSGDGAEAGPTVPGGAAEDEETGLRSGTRQAQAEPTVIGGAAADEETGLQSGIRQAQAARAEPGAALARNSGVVGSHGRMSIGRMFLLLLVAVAVPCIYFGLFIGSPTWTAAEPSTPPASAEQSASAPDTRAGTGSAGTAIAPPPSTAARDLEWDRRSRLGSDGRNDCFYQPSADDGSVQLCLRPYHDLVSNAVRASGSWNECNELAGIWQRRASQGDVFFDIGANIGICTASLAAPGMAAEVFAFEPSEANLYYLTGTFLRNPSHLGRLRLFPVGLGDAAADLPLFAEPANAGHSVIGAPVGELGRAVPTRVGTIRVRRLDDLIRPPYPKIRLAKIDVEGFETKVLRGGRELFSSGAVRSVYFELSPFLRGQGSSRLELVNLFLEFGYEFRETQGQPMHRDQLQSIACRECPNCFANLFAIIAHHSPATAQQRLPRCPEDV